MFVRPEDHRASAESIEEGSHAIYSVQARDDLKAAKSSRRTAYIARSERPVVRIFITD